jgi:single-strand DNA-binding protein
MAASFSQTIILGNVGKDPEILSTNGGTVVANFSVATTKKFTKNNQPVEQTEWHNIVAFARTAEIIRDYVRKGSKIQVVGENRTRSWDDKDSGKKMYRTEIVTNQVSLLGGSNNGSSNDEADASSGYGNSNNGRASSNSGYDDSFGDQGITDSDIPF